MSDDALRPYDFSRLDDLYQYADRYNDLANYMCDELTMLEERAWQDADAQTLNDADAYLRKYVIATWQRLNWITPKRRVSGDLGLHHFVRQLLLRYC